MFSTLGNVRVGAAHKNRVARRAESNVAASASKSVICVTRKGCPVASVLCMLNAHLCAFCVQGKVTLKSIADRSASN